ncbi:MAG: hypothetical protein FJY75_07680 [Candidatus Eisenbacteria bacterium]|uniref:Uncharacterized protein n=1 Tax=Eiseniibacteriota bacterium TaxID=2212470 RepID=A0A938BNX7_UNCEI|nr:hypothetical protein [Candidatus Eisenbacteria bacterium]
MSLDPGIWLAALLTLGIFSFLYRDNPAYKVCEAIFVGVSAGYWFVSLFWQNIWPKLVLNLRDAAGLLFGHGVWDPRWLYLFAGILGLMMLMRLLPKGGWISRWPLAFIVGTTAGLYMITYLQSNAISQVHDTLVPLAGPGSGRLLFLPLPFAVHWNALFVFAGTFTGLVYFFFSVEHKRLAGGTARVGILFLMVTFGASFGYTVMSRMSLLIGRMDFLFGQWLGLAR